MLTVTGPIRLLAAKYILAAACPRPRCRPLQNV